MTTHQHADLPEHQPAEILMWLKAFGCTQAEAEHLMADIADGEKRARARREEAEHGH
jgi:hypothetical protein